MSDDSIERSYRPNPYNYMYDNDQKLVFRSMTDEMATFKFCHNNLF